MPPTKKQPVDLNAQQAIAPDALAPAELAAEANELLAKGELTIEAEAGDIPRDGVHIFRAGRFVVVSTHDGQGAGRHRSAAVAETVFDKLVDEYGLKLTKPAKAKAAK